MELYNNENDQVDALKRFFAENGKALAVGVILGVGALVGWRYWTSHQLDTARGSSLAYENAISPMVRLLLLSWRSSLSIKTTCRTLKSSFSRGLRPLLMIT